MYPIFHFATMYALCKNKLAIEIQVLRYKYGRRSVNSNSNRSSILPAEFEKVTSFYGTHVWRAQSTPNAKNAQCAANEENIDSGVLCFMRNQGLSRRTVSSPTAKRDHPWLPPYSSMSNSIKYNQFDMVKWYKVRLVVRLKSLIIHYGTPFVIVRETKLFFRVCVGLDTQHLFGSEVISKAKKSHQQPKPI